MSKQRPEKDAYVDSILAVRNPTDAEIHRINAGVTKFPYKQYMGCLIFRLLDVTFGSEGKHKIFLGMGELPEEIFTFSVLTRASLVSGTSPA